MSLPQTIRLCTEMYKACINSENLDLFLPYGSLAGFVTLENVTSVLQESADLGGDIEKYTTHILDNNAARIFVIIVWMMEDGDAKWFSLLQVLVDKNITDDQLPFTFVDVKCSRTLQMYSSQTKNHPPVHIKTITANEHLVLSRNQRQVHVPVFTSETFLYKIADNQLLPFLVADENGPVPRKGSFGDVRRAEIHESHLDQRLQKLCVESRDGFFEVAVKNILQDAVDAVGEDFFAKEANALGKVRTTISDPSSLIKPLVACETRAGGFLLFPWADGGNLVDFWRSHDGDRHNVDMLLWIIEQFKDMASSLAELHFKNCRHGDLKPENILYFEKENRLLISDMGLTTFHEQSDNTNRRNERGQRTSTPAGTYRYMPPDVKITKEGVKDSARTRQYDIWSMGCILCELLVWMVYGLNALEQMRFDTDRFYDKDSDNVHRNIINYLKRIEILAGAGDSAQLSLVKLIREDLLLKRYSENAVEQVPGCRAIATVMHKRLEEIYKKCEKSRGSRGTYLAAITGSEPQYAVHTTNGWLAPPDISPVSDLRAKSEPRSIPDEIVLGQQNGVEAGEVDSGDRGPHFLFQLRRPTLHIVGGGGRSNNSRTMSDTQEQSATIHSSWTCMSDNQFALSYFRGVAWKSVKPRRRLRGDVKLCSCCRSITSAQLFDSRCQLDELESRAASCELCSLLYQSLRRSGYYKNTYSHTNMISLKQTDGVIGVEEGSSLLSVFVPPGHVTIQGAARMGLPRLLRPASLEQMTLIKSWIGMCDSTHKCMTGDFKVGPCQANFRPRRLLDLHDPLHLVDTGSMKGALPDYVALSHCWGKLTDKEKLCTYNGNISQMKKRIPLQNLPRTFHDAVIVARGIGASYIWIDSLCIIQDDADDWAAEAAKMGHIFSSAYCTIAATSATSSLEGFLKTRPENDIVSLETPTGPVYVRPHIDNFHKDVEMGPLNQRGWVLQELALSRRSIFFTSTQMYWMCGETLYTETLSRLENAKAAFLGDAHFPKSVINYYRDGRQMLIQDLYERYSRLAFTKDWDRSVAILGLEDRLSKAFRTRAAHGMLAIYFPRLLLWKRAGSRQMPKIVQPPGSHHQPPSWSWFSRSGPIEYMPLQFEKVKWETGEFDSPFKLSAATSAPGKSRTAQSSAVFSACARQLHLTCEEYLISIIPDENDEHNRYEDLHGVIIGRDKVPASSRYSSRLHILVIRQVPERDFYERVGVATLQQRQVDDESTRVIIH